MKGTESASTGPVSLLSASTSSAAKDQFADDGSRFRNDDTKRLNLVSGWGILKECLHANDPIRCRLAAQEAWRNAHMTSHSSPPTVQSTPTISRLSLLLRHTNRAAAAAGGLGVLTAHAQAPEVTQAAVGADLFETLQILAQLVVHGVGQHLRVLAIDDVALPVEEPGWDLILRRVLDDGHDALELLGRDLAGAAGCVSPGRHGGVGG